PHRVTRQPASARIIANAVPQEPAPNTAIRVVNGWPPSFGAVRARRGPVVAYGATGVGPYVRAGRRRCTGLAAGSAAGATAPGSRWRRPGGRTRRPGPGGRRRVGRRGGPAPLPSAAGLRRGPTGGERVGRR